MRLFKNKQHSIGWDDITLNQFNQISEALKQNDEYTLLNLIEIVFKESDVKLTDVLKYTKQLEFLKTDIPSVSIPKTYNINNHTYTLNTNLTSISTAQFIDFTNYMKQPKFDELLSVFFIPIHHKYSDGYDMNEVKADMLLLPMPLVKSTAFFFASQLQIFVSLFRYYLMNRVKRMKMEKEKKKELLNNLKNMDLNNLASFPMSLSM